MVTLSTMQNYPIILSLPDGTDIIVEETNQPLKISIVTTGKRVKNEANQKEKNELPGLANGEDEVFWNANK